MSNDTVITVEGLSKAYVLGERDQHDTFFGSLAGLATAPLRNLRRLRQLNTFARGASGATEDDGLFWALKDVSFEVKRGEVLGIIGRNGAGKSTLLKLLSKIAEPTRGRAEIRGRVSALLEVGTGFHPELSGRENVYLNGTILGMRKAEIDAKFDEIVDFSGIEKFIDTPVKRYSSGMTVRLAFAVAAHLEPEILIIDEVLAVGDAEFQKKCLGKMQDVATGQGRTVLFVSHNMGAVRQLCSRAILLRQGSMVMDASTEMTISEYLSYLNHGIVNPFEDNPERSGSGEIKFVGARILNDSGVVLNELIAGQSATLEFDYANPGKVCQASIALTIINGHGVPIASLNSDITSFCIRELGDSGSFRCGIRDLPLPLGSYRVAVALLDGTHRYDLIPNALLFDVVSSTFYKDGKVPNPQYCAVLVRHEWSHLAPERNGVASV